MPQGTIRHYDASTRSGTLLDDHLREYAYDREAFASSGLHELRLGQRVRFELEGPEDDQKVTHLSLVSF